ncbi:unnamed protein product [marine sediment metagenome]|uniref:ABC transporter domain-containing protein n=1 Tax=marine sediment metagenome TaxID=412755 RepID=X1F3A8_9ZZZZ
MLKASRIKRTPEMDAYEEETGRLAVWKGETTPHYLKWKKKVEMRGMKGEMVDPLKEMKKKRKEMKQEVKQGKDVERDYDHLIVAENLHKTYLLGTTAVAALRGVDLTIDTGDFIDIMGPSGSGKTTLLNLIGGLDTPTKGKIFLEGRNIAMLSDNALADIRKQRIGFVFQFYNLLILILV